MVTRSGDFGTAQDFGKRGPTLSTTQIALNSAAQLRVLPILTPCFRSRLQASAQVYLVLSSATDSPDAATSCVPDGIAFRALVKSGIGIETSERLQSAERRVHRGA